MLAPHGRLLAAALAASVFGPLALACGGDDDDATSAALPASTSSADPSRLSGTITVFAASSLAEAFNEAGLAFETKNPDTRVVFSFGASSALAVQINEGAPADVFASADNAQMKVVMDRGNAQEPRPFVKNHPVVVVRKGDSVVAAFPDLAKPGLRVILAAPEVPIGRYSREILTNASATPGGVSADFSAKVLKNLVSNEPNVRAVLTKVQLGEADAGIVYRTDVPAAGGEAVAVEIPAPYNVVAEYPIAILLRSRERDVAEAFVAFILSGEGQAAMQKFGFSAP